MKSAWIQILVSLILGFVIGIAFDTWYGGCSCCSPLGMKQCLCGSVYKCPCCGMKGHFGLFHKGKDFKQHVLKHISKDLKLTEEQNTKVATVFESTQKEMKKLHEEIKPRFEAIRTATQNEIRKILTPEQQKTFDEQNAKREAHRKAWEAKSTAD